MRNPAGSPGPSAHSTAVVSGDSLAKGVISSLLGMLLATVGPGPVISYPRFTFGTEALTSGIQFIAVLIGLFGVAEGLYRYLTGLAHEKAEQEITWLVPDSGLLARILLSLGSSVVWFFVVYVAILVVGLIGARFWARSIDFPPKYLCPVIFVLSLVGAFALRGNVLDVWITIGAGVLGYLMRTQDYPLAPMVLGLVLGPIAEVNLRRALTLSDGSLDIFLSDPLTFAILVLSVVSLLYPVVQQWRTRATA